MSTCLDQYRAFARYNRWMNEKLYALATELGDEERKRDRGAFFGSIHATLNHLLLADRVWLGRLTGAKLEPDWMGPGAIRSLDQELYADWATLREQRAKTDVAIDAWVATLTEETLASTLTYVSKGASFAWPTWWCAAQLFNHQTHHRGQVTTLLMQAGRDPGATDLFAMLRAEATAAVPPVS